MSASSNRVASPPADQSDEKLWQFIQADCPTLREHVTTWKVFSREAQQEEESFWNTSGMTFDRWIAPYCYNHRRYCLRLNHPLGYGCTDSHCYRQHLCLLCGRNHGAFQKNVNQEWRCDWYRRFLAELHNLGPRPSFTTTALLTRLQAVVEFIKTRTSSAPASSILSSSPSSSSSSSAVVFSAVNSPSRAAAGSTLSLDSQPVVNGSTWAARVSTGTAARRNINPNSSAPIFSTIGLLACPPSLSLSPHTVPARTSLASPVRAAGTAQPEDELGEQKGDAGAGLSSATEATAPLASASIASAGDTNEEWTERLSEEEILHVSWADEAILGESQHATVRAGEIIIAPLGRELTRFDVAVKMCRLPERRESRSDSVERLRKEARILQQLNPTYAVKFKRVIEQKCLHRSYYYCLVMDRMDQNLAQYVCDPENVIPAEQLSQMLLQLLFAYDHCHSPAPDNTLVRVYHRDVKPENILVQTDPHSGHPILKLCDFGLSQEYWKDASSMLHSSMVGTVDEKNRRCWIAPEVLKNSDYSLGPADVWSLGCVLHFVYTKGMALFSSRTEACDETKRGDYLKRHHLHEIDSLVFDLVNRLTHPNPVCRPTPREALTHPATWSSSFVLHFINQLYEELHRDRRHHQHVINLAAAVDRSSYTNQWHLNSKMTDWYDQVLDYTVRRSGAVELIKALRHVAHHLEKLSSAWNSRLREALVPVIIESYPLLLPELWVSCKEFGSFERSLQGCKFEFFDPPATNPAR